MYYLKHRGWGLVIFVFFIVSCGAGMVTPSKGVTNRFFRQVENRSVNLADYDFSRLNQGYGLCMFSYEFSGTKGNRIIGRSRETKKGLRVWEHRFSTADLNTTWVDKSMMVWGYRGLSTFFLTKSGYDIRVSVPFHKGLIIYSGRLIVDFPAVTRVESHFDEDVASWFDEFGENITQSGIETELMVEWLE